MAYDFTYFIEQLEAWGIADVLLPFLLVFTIVFAILQKTNIIGEKGKNKNFNVIIALALGLSVVIPHVLGTYPSGMDVVDIMNEALPQISLVAIAFLMAMLLAGLVGYDLGKGVSGFLVFLALVLVAVIFGNSMGWWETNWLYDLFGEETISVLLMIIVFGVIIWYITGEDKKHDKTWADNIEDFFKRFVGGKQH